MVLGYGFLVIVPGCFFFFSLFLLLFCKGADVGQRLLARSYVGDTFLQSAMLNVLTTNKGSSVTRTGS